MPNSASPFVAPRETLHVLHLEKLAETLQKHGFEASVTPTLADAAKLVLDKLLPESGAKTVSFGGSMTVREAGLLEALKARADITVMDTFDMSAGLEAVLELRRQALLCDLYLCSVNAVTRDGTLMLVDGFGNRTAAVQYGPRKVILLVGRNKLCTTLESGFERVRSIAAPANGLRLNRKTPCAETGYCMDCKSPDRMCATWTLTMRCFPQKRIHVVLIDEEVGF